MHVVLIHHERIPVKLYGGTERVVEALCRGLIEFGHKVSLICYRGDYQISGVNFLDLDRFGSKKAADERYMELVPDDADVLHFQVPMDQDHLDLKGIPYIVTLHGNLQDDEDPSKLPKNTIFVSENHARRHGREHFVYNGLDHREIPLFERPLHERDYFSFLGRASLKRKGLHNAKAIAKSLKVPLHVGGGRGLGFGGVKYLGHVDNQQKYNLLGNSKGLLFPIEWEEPFGLVMIEAMFTGSPVFAFLRGSVPEVLGQEGSDGLFLVGKNSDELTEKIRRFSFNKDPRAFRDYAQRYFSYVKMCEKYLEYYSAVVDRRMFS